MALSKYAKATNIVQKFLLRINAGKITAKEMKEKLASQCDISDGCANSYYYKILGELRG